MQMINRRRHALLLTWFVGVNVVFYVVTLIDRFDQLMELWHRLSPFEDRNAAVNSQFCHWQGGAVAGVVAADSI